ncbi:MAG: matrixin family metalloprotease [Actinobacteria bacterium]|nr:matrixin family metalloprotease [Actinomycetota bacterium]
MSSPVRRRIAVAIGAAVVAVAGGVWLASLGDDVSRTPTEPVSTTAPSIDQLPDVAPLPDLGAVKGSPTELDVPEGGEAEVRATTGGRMVTLSRENGSPVVVAEIDREGDYHAVRVFDQKGEVELVISRLDVAPAGASSSTRRLAGCRNVRRLNGPKWRRFPIKWRFNPVGVPRSVGASRALSAVRAARASWGGNRNRCRIRDRAASGFSYQGTTRRRIGRDGISTVEFSEIDRLGGVCRGALACTYTWSSGGRAIESDILVDRNPTSGLAAGSRIGRNVDLQSVFVHESGHTLGFGHVYDASNVMYPSITRGTRVYRRLGKGDAVANNSRY